MKIGSYILLVKIKNKAYIKVGKLGKLKFEKGLYAYIGSAMNGIKKRTERRAKIAKTKKGRLRWHIDYLLVNKNSELVELIKIPTNRRIECELSRLFQKFAIPIIGFGSSDCKCKSHLYRLK
jgi:Uri superfamily endonuclease